MWWLHNDVNLFNDMELQLKIIRRVNFILCLFMKIIISNSIWNVFKTLKIRGNSLLLHGLINLQIIIVIVCVSVYASRVFGCCVTACLVVKGQLGRFGSVFHLSSYWIQVVLCSETFYLLSPLLGPAFIMFYRLLFNLIIVTNAFSLSRIGMVSAFKMELKIVKRVMELTDFLKQNEDKKSNFE